MAIAERARDDQAVFPGVDFVVAWRLWNTPGTDLFGSFLVPTPYVR
ncbi:hypothetical protein [Lentilactobacillus hilgardii]